MRDARDRQHDDGRAEEEPTPSAAGTGRTWKVVWRLVKATRAIHWVWEQLGDALDTLGGG